ncbi:hypothetical protein HPS56_11250 [Prevotella sp. PMUR]|uniref:DUF4252 domain-containing protein n=2 Tax=Xylanibacter muris TaxID=2736290 RepID=A0ABX2APJ6_9BACT|nr:hypothetical protein [Xylanibacter muris]
MILRLITASVIMLAGITTAGAQEDLNINRIFERYGHEKGCKLVVMHNTRLKKYRLDVYKALVYKKRKIDTDTYLNADRKNAIKIREVVDNGKTVSGYYMMKPKEEGKNRYILFSKVYEHEGAVIYIEGPISPDDIMKLCYSAF